MSGLPQNTNEDRVNGVDVREQGSALRVATNTPHLVSLGTGRLSTAVTLHPIKQGRVIIGSDPTCDIYVLGTGVASVHCRVENSHGVVTLYPISGSTLLDGLPVEKPTRLCQGSMLTIGRSNYLRFNHPAEAELMKSVLPSGRVSMAAIQFRNDDSADLGYLKHQPDSNYQSKNIQDKTLSQLDQEFEKTLKEMRKKPPVPKKPNREEYSDSDQESQRPKLSSIMSKVSKFEYYAKSQQKNVSRSQFYTHENDISPKVFTSESLTVNTPAKDVLGGKNAPSNYKQKILILNENNAIEQKSCNYVNVAIKNRNKIEEIVRNFDENAKLPKKVNNDQQNMDNLYGRINNDLRNFSDKDKKVPNNLDLNKSPDSSVGPVRSPKLPSPAFDRDPQYKPVYHYAGQIDRSLDAENKRQQAYQDRIKEQELKDAENARLEEILNMCADYERQISSGTPITPTEKRSHNKIITNGSLPRCGALNNPNFVQTSEGYYKFDINTNINNSMSRSLPPRNISNYENVDNNQTENSPKTRMDEIGIPIFDDYRNQLSNPIMIRKLQNSNSPIGSPYENVMYNRAKPNSPNTSSPRTRIKTTFAHKNLPSPQYFVFPTPPPIDKKPNFDISIKGETEFCVPNNKNSDDTDLFDKNKVDNNKIEDDEVFIDKTNEIKNDKPKKFDGIEKQLSLEEEIPMIDDSNVTNDLEFRYSKSLDSPKLGNENQSFDDVRKELMADIPELDQFERELKDNRDRVVNYVNVDVDASDSILSLFDVKELRDEYERLKDGRKKIVSEIHELKCKMSDIRTQEDDILRELEMEKALIKGEYDSEIAILNIEQKKKGDLTEKLKKIENDIKNLKSKQEARQNEMEERVRIATLKVDRLEKDFKSDSSTLEELQNAQDILDNESKMCEDLEFQHLEEESELLANREDLQNEIAQLNKKIESQKKRILTLKSEANENLTSALDETKVLQAEYVKHLNKVEELTTKVQSIEKELKPIINKLNDIERTQSPDSAFYTDQTRGKSGEFSYTPHSSDSDDIDINKISEEHQRNIHEKFNSIDQMSQSMIVDIERREIIDIVDNDSPKSKEKKGFWERNFDSLSRKKKKSKSPEKKDIMSQSLNENMFNNDSIEIDDNLDRFDSLRNSKKKVVKSNSSSKIPTFAALGKIIKKDSFGKKNDDTKPRYIKNGKVANENKYKVKVSPEKLLDIKESDEKVDKKLQNLSLDEKSEKDKISDWFPKVLHRKSYGDEPNGNLKFSEAGKISSQDDIDRISKVTLDAPILSDSDMNSLGKKTVDSLKEIERKRLVMLEEQGSQVIENEREKISELKRRVQNEAKILYDQKCKREQSETDKCQMQLSKLYDDSDSCQPKVSQSDVNHRLSNSFDDSKERASKEFESFEANETSLMEDSLNVTGSTGFDESSCLMSSSIEELPARNSRTESTEDDKRSDDSRPLSHASDFSRENILSLPGAPRRNRRTIAPYNDAQRPLTRYLPVDRDDFDLRQHIESAGHQVDLCPHVIITTNACRGYLHKLGAKFHTWSKRWFVFDRDTKTFVYYWDKNERKPRGGAYFQVIEEVYMDHGNVSKSPNPQTTFIVKTRQKRYSLMAPSGEAARIWIDVVFTGAQGYTEYLE